MNFEVVVSAFFIGLGLIVAIGAQNVFIIKTGLQQRKVFVAASIAASCDFLLIVAGVFFMASLKDQLPWFVPAARWLGIVFVLYYGALSLLNALRQKPRGWANVVADAEQKTAGKTVALAALGFTLLNPHVYLDTFMILGNLGSEFAGMNKLSFIIGACLASFLWFFGIAYAAKSAAQLFTKVWVIRCFDLVVALVMLVIAYNLYQLK
ncbi:LysE family transporter [Pseudomonas sp. F1_0610]|uniref:LysE/ArgO family amino acid transporter n=1 Tax=Pseudomonas sp. F1_0610 TaxID=3114284 RepID=UPI0039C1799A